MAEELPESIAFEGRLYRLDRVALVKPEDLVVVRVRKPYEPPKLRSSGKVAVTTGSGFTDTNTRKKPQG